MSKLLQFTLRLSDDAIYITPEFWHFLQESLELLLLWLRLILYEAMYVFNIEKLEEGNYVDVRDMKIKIPTSSWIRHVFSSAITGLARHDNLNRIVKELSFYHNKALCKHDLVTLLSILEVGKCGQFYRMRKRRINTYY